MNIGHIIGLAAAVAFSQSLHAQGCSGGAGGGVDATGNQCSDGTTIRLYADGSDAASPLPTPKMSGISQSTRATDGKRPTAKMSALPAASIAPKQGTTSLASAATPPHASVKTSKIETADASPCAGGPDGGTDATGNQCNAPVDVAPPALASSPDAGAATKAPAATPAAGSPPPMKAAAHRKKVFDERRARFEDAGHPRVAAAPGPAASSLRSAP